MGRKRRKGKHSVKTYIVFALFLLLLIAGTLAWGIKNRIEPNLEEVGSIRAKVVVSQIVNKAVNDQLYATNDMEELLIRKTNESGQMELLQANTQAMNVFITEISKELQEEYAARQNETFEVSLGTLLGDRILSQTGPAVQLRIKPLSVSSIDFKTEFESQGINQTKYKVYIDLTSDVKVLAPFAEETFQVSTTVLVAEAIILGGVPASYVNVPEEDILDVTNE